MYENNYPYLIQINLNNNTFQARNTSSTFFCFEGMSKASFCSRILHLHQFSCILNGTKNGATCTPWSIGNIKYIYSYCSSLFSRIPSSSSPHHDEMMELRRNNYYYLICVRVRASRSSKRQSGGIAEIKPLAGGPTDLEVQFLICFLSIFQ